MTARPRLETRIQAHAVVVKFIARKLQIEGGRTHPDTYLVAVTDILAHAQIWRGVNSNTRRSVVKTPVALDLIAADIPLNVNAVGQVVTDKIAVGIAGTSYLYF